jgi:hypothetical protein
MTHTILKSALAPQATSYEAAKGAFAKLVDVYIGELQAWHDHHEVIKVQPPLRRRPMWHDFAKETNPVQAYGVDAAKWQRERLAHHDPYPRPIGHPDIVASVAETVVDGKTTFAPDFEIEDDDPTSERILSEKKTNLLQQALMAEETAKAAVLLPVGKRRAANLLESDIRAADPALAVELLKPIAVEDRSTFDLEGALRTHRDPSHTKHLDDQDARRKKVDAIMRTSAKTMNDIEDLTAENVDQFVIPAFL